MIDQNTFINTYIDIIVAQLIDGIKSNLQLQTQVKVSEFVIAEKDQIIASLNQQLSENRVAEDWKAKYEGAENNYNAILGKLNHMNNLLTQVGDMKKQILERDAVINNLKQEIEELKNPKKVINTKTVKKKEDTPLVIVKETKQDKTLDDF